jgi:hypothetical protein
MARIFLHIGTNKTGTSAIQSFFSHNREQAREHGFLYPETACSGSAHYALSGLLGFNLNKHKRCAKRADDAEWRAIRESLDREIADTSPSAIMFSSENFVIGTPLEPVRDFFGKDDVRILAYLRRHDSWWAAAYSQAVKAVSLPPWGQGIEGFIRFRKKRAPQGINYRHLLDRWAAVFGREHLIVRPYEQQQNEPDIVVDVLRAIDLDMGLSLKTSDTAILDAICSKRRNESLSPHALHLMEMFQRARIATDMHVRLIGYAKSLPASGSRQSILSPLRRLQLIEENAADYAYIAKEYLGREDGRLFYDPLPDPDEPWEPLKPLAPPQIVEETVRALIGDWRDAKV